jgi:hypothetical protein
LTRADVACNVSHIGFWTTVRRFFRRWGKVTDENIGEPNEDTGRELQKFFIELLASGDDMKDYTTPSSRQGVIARKELSPYAQNLLKKGSLREIEENIAMIPGSQARPWLIVWPPM